MSLYGTQDASANWEAEYSKCLIEGGYQKGEASPCLFYNASSNVRALVHGDDFVAVGRRGPLMIFRSTLSLIMSARCSAWDGQKADAGRLGF